VTIGIMKICRKCNIRKNRGSFVAGMCRKCAGAEYVRLRKPLPPRECTRCKVVKAPNLFNSCKSRRCTECVEEVKANALLAPKPYKPAGELEGFNDVMQRFIGGGSVWALTSGSSQLYCWP